MISEELQLSCKKRFNGTSRMIVLANDSQERLDAFHKAMPSFMLASDDVAIGPNNNVWHIVRMTNNTYITKHIVEAIVDSQLDERLFNERIVPACEVRCVRMEFFE